MSAARVLPPAPGLRPRRDAAILLSVILTAVLGIWTMHGSAYAQDAEPAPPESAPQEKEPEQGTPERDDTGPPLPRFERFEVVAGDASVPDASGSRPGNSWGGHQTRVLRMESGEVYTAYLKSGPSFDTSEWHLVRRNAAGWEPVATGIAGREPVNILRTPGNGVAIVAWPRGSPVLTTFDFSDASGARRERPIPGQWEINHWPYNAAGIDFAGTLCALQSHSALSPGAFLWACGSLSRGTWEFQRTPLQHRHAYTYVLPEAQRLTLTSTRDVTWATLGHPRPPGASDYAFNQVHAYQVLDRRFAALAPILVREEAPTSQYPAPQANGQTDAYLDTAGRLHVLYTLAGQSTGGGVQTRHALLINGRVTADVRLPQQGWWRITQDSTGAFWALYGSGKRFSVYPALSDDGLELGDPTELDLGAEQVRYAGMAIAAPRAGVPLDDIVDGGFPSGNAGERWVYFRLRLR